MQVYTIDSNSTVEIMAWRSDGNLKMILESVVKLNGGVASFENIGFIGTPKSSNNEFYIWS